MFNKFFFNIGYKYYKIVRLSINLVVVRGNCFNIEFIKDLFLFRVCEVKNFIRVY